MYCGIMNLTAESSNKKRRRTEYLSKFSFKLFYFKIIQRETSI